MDFIRGESHVPDQDRLDILGSPTRKIRICSNRNFVHGINTRVSAESVWRSGFFWSGSRTRQSESICKTLCSSRVRTKTLKTSDLIYSQTLSSKIVTMALYRF